MLQPCGIGIGLKEHSNRVTPKAYTPKSLSGPLPPDSCPTQKKKHLNTQTLPMNYAMHTTTQLFSKSQLFF